MDKKELQKIPKLVKEIEFLRKQIEYADIEIQPRMVADSVKGSSAYFPFHTRMYSVIGIDLRGYDRQVKRLKRKLQLQMNEYINKVNEAQTYIASIDDSRTRTVLQCRFISGLTWEQIEAEAGIAITTAKRTYKVWRDYGK